MSTMVAMAMAIGTETTAPHRMTVEEFERFVEATGADRVELVDGAVYDVSPEGPAHADITIALLLLLMGRYPDRVVKNAGSVRLDDGSLWEPDAYVLDQARGRIASVGDSYPTADAVLLAVEVAVTTLSHDQRVKLPVYARNGVPEYWVVRPTGSVTCYTNPDGDRYRRSETFHLDLVTG